jgi:hypothetical protein
LVAGLDLCLDRIFHLRYPDRCYWSHWCAVSYFIPCCFESVVWSLGFVMAGF